MLDPQSLYELVDRGTGPPPGGGGTVLVHALDGFLDAGSAGRLAAAHLTASLAGDEAEIVARFDVDQLYDYRARRPALLFVEDHYEEYDAPELAIRRLRDPGGAEFLLLAGPEPDVAWEAFAASLVGLVDRLGVRLTIGLGGVPMTVPHTRPITLTTHASRPELVSRPNVWRGRIRVPASAAALLELRQAAAGQDAMGFVAHVPHYLAAVEYGDAAVALLEAVSDVTELTLPTGTLREAAAARRREIDAQIADDEQARELVRALEAQYDAFVEAGRGNALDPDTPLPTGEELGSELERFLAQLDHRDDERGS